MTATAALDSGVRLRAAEQLAARLAAVRELLPVEIAAYDDAALAVFAKYGGYAPVPEVKVEGEWSAGAGSIIDRQRLDDQRHQAETAVPTGPVVELLAARLPVELAAATVAAAVTTVPREVRHVRRCAGSQSRGDPDPAPYAERPSTDRSRTVPPLQEGTSPDVHHTRR